MLYSLHDLQYKKHQNIFFPIWNSFYFQAVAKWSRLWTSLNVATKRKIGCALNKVDAEKKPDGNLMIDNFVNDGTQNAERDIMVQNFADNTILNAEKDIMV